MQFPCVFQQLDVGTDVSVDKCLSMLQGSD